MMTDALITLSLSYGKSFDLTNSSAAEYMNGTTFLSMSTELSPSQLLIHNLAHFMCASPLRRLEADFALGSSPDSPIVLPSLIPLITAQYEEELTVYLSKIIASAVGNTEEMFDHNVTKEQTFISQLISWNILDYNLKLTGQVRTTPDQTLGIFRTTDKKPYDLSLFSKEILSQASSK